MATSDSIVKILKSTIAGRRPANDPALAGQPYVNYADKQFGVIDVAGKPVDLLALRHWTANASYANGDMVVHTGSIYQCLLPNTDATFTGWKWKKVTDVEFTDALGNSRGTLKFVDANGNIELTLTDAGGTAQNVIRMKPDGSIEFPNAPATASGTKTLITNEMLAAKIIGDIHSSPAAGSKQEIVPGAGTDVPLSLKGAAGQTADLLQAKNPAGAVVFKIAPDGSATVAGDLTVTGALHATVAGVMIYKGAIDPTGAYALPAGIKNGWYYTSSGAGPIATAWATHFEASVTSVGLGDVMIWDGTKFVHMRNQVTPPVEPVQVLVDGYTTDVAVRDGAGYFHISPALNNKDLVTVHAAVITAGAGGVTSVQVHNLTKNVDMLTTMLTIDAGETGSNTAAAAAVISTVNKKVAVNDMLRIDVKAVSPTTAPQGLLVTLEFN